MGEGGHLHIQRLPTGPEPLDVTSFKGFPTFQQPQPSQLPPKQELLQIHSMCITMLIYTQSKGMSRITTS